MIWSGDIRGVHSAISVRVAEKQADCQRLLWQRLFEGIGRTIYSICNLLCISHASQTHGHGVATQRWLTSNTADPVNDARVATCQIIVKRKDKCVISATTASTFKARRTGQRKIDIERSCGSAVSFARRSADQRKLRERSRHR